MRIDNLADGLAEMRAMLKEMRQYFRATPLNNSTIGRGGLRLYGGGRITIENNGGITITGPDGELVGSGTIDWTGTMNNTGPVNLNGDTTISKNLIVQALTRLLGALTLEADMVVKNGGKITAGVLTIDPTGGTFGGALVSANAIDVVAPSFHTSGNIFSQGTITSNALLRAEVNASVGSDLTVGGKITNTNMPTTPAAGKTANVWQDPSTKILYRMI